MSKQSNYNLLFFILFFISLEAIFFDINNYKINRKISLENYKLVQAEDILAKVKVEAKAVSVYNITQQKILYGKDNEVAMPLASLSKIMTIIVVLNTYSPDDTISVSQNAINQAGDYGLFANEKWKVGDLAKLTLIVSANDGAYALSENIPNFLQKISDKAKKIGTQETLFLSSTGLDLPSGKASAFASAQDVNLMSAFAYKDYPTIFSTTILPEIKIKSLSGFDHTVENTDTILADIPNLLFSKTGFTNIAGGNLCIIFKNEAEDDIAITVLGSTFSGRFSDMQKLVKVANYL
jgi:D-alanyl-D-alanine carboxypeptidase